MKKLLGLLVLIVLLAPPAVLAGTATANLQVTVTVDAACGVTTNPLTFPDYNPVGTNATIPDDGTGFVVLQCSTGLSAHIGLDRGLNTGRMQDQLNNFVSYALYQDANRTITWGNTSGSWVTSPPALNTIPQIFTVYGRIPPGQTSPSGAYSDTVVATVNF